MSFEIPSDNFGRPLYNITPRGTALARTMVTPNTSHLVTLNSATRLVRVYAAAKDVLLKWANSDVDYCTASNFDEVIPTGTYLDLYVPLKTDGTNYSLLQVVGRETGATVIILEK